MKKFLTIAVIIACIFAVYKLLSNNPSKSSGVSDKQADIILFWGDGCPHCEALEKYITENKFDDKVKINRKEVWYNKSNQEFLMTTVKNCPEIDTTKGVGVPFAFINSTKKCLVGDQPIEDWLNSKK